MFPWGAIVGLAGIGESGILSTINNRSMQRDADAEAARQKAFYDAKANENSLSRSEVQQMLGQYDRAANQQIENARGVATVTGATPEFSAAVQKGVAEGRANLMGDVTADASRRKDYFSMLGEQAKHQKAMEDQMRRYERNQTYAALAANAASAFGSIMDGYGTKSAPEKGRNAAATKSPQLRGSYNLGGGVVLNPDGTFTNKYNPLSTLGQNTNIGKTLTAVSPFKPKFN